MLCGCGLLQSIEILLVCTANYGSVCSRDVFCLVNHQLLFLVPDSPYVSITSILHVFLAKNLLKWNFPFSSLTNCIEVHFSWLWLAWPYFVKMLVKPSAVKYSQVPAIACMLEPRQMNVSNVIWSSTREKTKLNSSSHNFIETLTEFFLSVFSGISRSYLPCNNK